MNRKQKEVVIRIERWPRRAGKKELLKHLNGESLTRQGAIRAKCYECVAGDDFTRCNVLLCPLTQYSPWNSKNDSDRGEEQ